MFRIVCLVDDKHLPAVLHALAGKVREMEPPVPVANARPKGKQGAAALTNGNLTSLFGEHLKKLGGKEITTRQTKDFLEGIGRTPASYGHVLKEAVKAKLVRKTGKGHSTRYHII